MKSYELLCYELGLPIQQKGVVLDVIGCPVKQFVLVLGLRSSKLAPHQVQSRFTEIFETVLLTYSRKVTAQAGAIEILQEIIKNQDELCITTSLPRDIAVKAIVLSGISTVLQGRVDPSRLICMEQPAARDFNKIDPHQQLGILGKSSIYTKCCGIMRRPSFLTVLFDRNRRCIAQAKRMGLNIFGIRGMNTKSTY